MPVEWRMSQDFSKNLRPALQLEAFVDALFVSSSMAQLCQTATRGDSMLNTKYPVEDPREGGFQTQSRRSIWPGARRLVGQWRPPFSQQTSAQHLNNEMTKNPPLPQGLQKSAESTEKVCAHVANPCFRDKTMEDMIARKSCPLQWDTSAEMANF